MSSAVIFYTIKNVRRFVDENYVITAKNGPIITASNERHSITRNSSLFNKATFNGAGIVFDYEYELSASSPSTQLLPVIPEDQPHPQSFIIANSSPYRNPKPIDRYGYPSL